MAFNFESCDADASDMSELSIERVRFALRLTDGSGSPSPGKVLFSDMNGPRGSEDIRC